MITKRNLHLLQYAKNISASQYGIISVDLPSLIQIDSFPVTHHRLKSTFRGSIGSNPAYKNKVQKIFYKQTIPQAQQTEKNKKIRSELVHNSRVQAALTQKISYQNIFNIESNPSTATTTTSTSSFKSPNFDTSRGNKRNSQERAFHSSRYPFQETNSNVLHLEEFDEYEKIIKKTDGKAVIYFTATWCPPCKMIKPIFHQLATKFTEEQAKDKVLFGQVDVDDNGDAAVHGNISSIPAFHFYHNGKCIKKFSGADPNQLEEEISELVEK